MIDIAQQVAYWRDGAREDWAVAQDLMAQGRVRHALFCAHLALEKALKAHVCRQTNDLAPRLHNLVRLAEMAMYVQVRITRTYWLR
jgi:HEPN domain-containing protein